MSKDRNVTRRDALKLAGGTAALGALGSAVPQLAEAAAPMLGVSRPSIYRFKLGRCLRGAYWLSVLTTVHAFGLWSLFFLFWVAPALTIFPMLMQLREIAHHANAPDAGPLTNSRVFRVHPALRYCVFPYGLDFHLSHHLFMGVPCYRLPDVHAALGRAGKHDAMTIAPDYLHVLRQATARPAAG